MVRVAEKGCGQDSPRLCRTHQPTAERISARQLIRVHISVMRTYIRGVTLIRNVIIVVTLNFLGVM